MTVEEVKCRVGAASPLTLVGLGGFVGLDRMRAVVSDSHFLVPFFVLLAGIALLVVLH